MALLISQSNNIEYNLALEEYFLRYYPLEEDILYIWQGSKAFVFGRNQNPFIEIHPKYLLDQTIPKLRRVSGGGTIYQDKGTINFSFITKNYKNKINDYEYFLSPLVGFLNNLGLEAYFEPKSHIFINAYKVSGNAQAFINNRLMHHGTILFNTSLNIIEEALINYSYSVTGHQVLSNKQEVINIKTLINSDISSFIQSLAKYIMENRDISSNKVHSIDQSIVLQLVEDKYKTWEWNYGQTPKFKTKEIINNKTIELIINKGIIEKVSDQAYINLLGKRYTHNKNLK